MQSLQERSRRLQIGLAGQVWLFAEFARLVSNTGSGRDSPPGGQVIYWLGSFRGDLVVKRLPCEVQANAWARRSCRPQSRAGRDREGRRGQPPILQSKGGGRAAVALLTARPEGGLETERPGKGPEWWWLGPPRAPRVPSARTHRGREEVSALCCSDLLLLFGGRKLRYQRRGPRGPGRGASGWGPGGDGARGRRAARQSRPPFAAARGRAGLCALRSSLLPRQWRRPQPRALRAPRPAPRGPAAVTRRAALAASALRFVEPEPSDRRGLSPPGP